jgi:serine/threonine-protein kinase PknK
MPQTTPRIAYRYDQERELGRGSMGRVVLVRGSPSSSISARAVPTASRWALKVLNSPELRADFVREYRLLCALSHPGFVLPHRLVAFSEGGRPALGALLEFVDGAPLVPGDHALVAPEIGRRLLSALDHLHRLNLVHGDLAPANILWRQSPTLEVKLLDLGAAGESGSRADTTTGILEYCAPERLAGAPLNPSQDLWSVGALLFGLVHGRHPFPNYPASRSPLPERTGLEPHLLDPWLDRLLSLKATDRHPSASAALAELESIVGIAPTPLFVLPLPSHDPERTPTSPGLIGRAAQLLASALSQRISSALDLHGLPSSGRSHALRMITDELAIRGLAVIDLSTPVANQRWLHHALDALDADSPQHASELSLIERLGHAVRGSPLPICLAIDDLDSRPELRALLARLVRAVKAAPERFGGLSLLTVGLGAPECERLDLHPWSLSDLQLLLERRFPARTIRERDVEALLALTRGQIGHFASILEDARLQGALRVDSTSLRLDLDAVSPADLDAPPRDLSDLSDNVLHSLSVVAWARLPFPADSQLLDAGLTIAVQSGHVLLSNALVGKGRRLLPETAAHELLAKRYEAAGFPSRAVLHQLLHRPVEPIIAKAEDLLRHPLESAEHSALLDALESLPTWPTSSTVALVAARLRLDEGRIETTRRHLESARDLAQSAEQRLDALHELATFELARGRLLEAFSGFGHLVELETRPLPLLDALTGKARAEALTGALDDADKTLARAHGIVSDMTPPLLLARLDYARGLILWYRGRLDEAEPALGSALSHARKAAAPSEEAAIITAQGLIAHRRGDLELATAAYLDAMKVAEKAHDEARVLSSLQNLGVVRHERGDLTEALDTYLHALSVAETLEARTRIAQISGNLGNLFRYLGRSERARTVLERGLELARLDRNPHLESLLLNLLGDVACDLADLPRAESCYRNAIQVADAHGHLPEASEANLNLARVLIERFDLAEAQTEIARATNRLDRNPGAVLSFHRVLLGAIDAALLRRRGEDASVRIQEALTELDKVKNPDLRCPVLLEAALIARDRNDLASAERWSLELRRTLQNQLDRVPADHRDTFSIRRDRRAALRETAPLLTSPRQDTHREDALGWGRLLEIHKRLASEHSVQRLLEYIMDSAILLTQAERGFLLLTDGSPEGLEVRIARNLDQENLRQRHLKISRGIAHRVLSTGEPIITLDAMEDERYRDQLSVVDQRLRSIICLPLGLRGRILGALYLDHRFRSAAFSSEDLRFMEAFADMAAIALDNARLLESLDAQRAQTEKAKREIESLNERLTTELANRTRELEDTRVSILHERQKAAVAGLEHIIGEAPPLRRIFQMIERLRSTDIPVLVQGESGTGKELVARALHFSGPRKDRPFVAVNCGAIPSNLLESELFGHLRGAFTNATSEKKGLFEVAHTGTIFLDEIGEMPLEMQVKLLRVLQSGELQKLGATRQIRVDVRVVTATNRKLDEEVRALRFREDLFYRLSVVTLQMPPLRDRREDIPLLVAHFLEQNRKSGLSQISAISKDALAALQRYSWPGNVRQLETVLKSASVFADTDTLTLPDLQAFPEIANHQRPVLSAQPNAKFTGLTLADIERMVIVDALRENHGNKKKTAEQLGIDRRTLYNKLAAYEIEIEAGLQIR